MNTTAHPVSLCVRLSDGTTQPLGATLPVAATGTFTSDNTNFADGETVTFTGSAGTWTYVFRPTLTGVTTERQVLIGADADTSLTNFRFEISKSTGNPFPYGSFGAVSAHALPFTASATFMGTIGNAIGTTDTCAHASWGGSVLSGGTDPSLKVDTSGGTAGATAANQVTQITAEQAILAKLPAVGGAAPAASIPTISGQSAAAPTNTAGTGFTPGTTDATVFTITAGQTGYIQNHAATVLYYKLGASCSTSSYSGALKACGVADDATGGQVTIRSWTGVVSVAKASGSAKYSAWVI